MVYLFYGEESYLLDAKVAELTKAIEMPEMNVSTFTEDYELSALTQAAYTLPFLSEKRAVVLRVADFKGDDELKNMLAKLPESVDFIIATENLDKRSSLYKAYKAQATECAKPALDKVIQFVARAAKKEGRFTEKAAAEEVIRRLNYYDERGVNLYAILGVVRQIAVTSDITVPAVTATLPDSAAGKAYSLAALLCEGNADALFPLAQYLTDSGESEIGLMASISRVFRLAWKAKVGLTPEAPKFQYQAALRFSAERLSSVLDTFSDASARIKDGGTASVVFPVALVKALQALHNKAA